MMHRKPVTGDVPHSSPTENGGLVRRLGWVDLLLVGIGVIVGGGIFIVTGTAAAQFAGPAITLSFLLAALGCALAGLCYAELAAALPVQGGAYGYCFVTLGEVFAWFAGWFLIVEYLCAASYIAVGWSGYVTAFLASLGVHLPLALTTPGVSIAGGRIAATASINLPAIFVVLAAFAIARRGIGVSSVVNSVLVAAKLVVLLLFIGAGAFYIDPANWIPFIPANTGVFGHFGWSGVLRGAVVVFVVFLGFDAVSTLAQETRDPQRNVPRGILAAIAICTLLYVAVSLVMTGLVSFTALDVSNPLSVATRAAGGGLDWLAPLIEIVAMSGLASVLLILLTALSRIYLAMAQDGLLPAVFAHIHPRFHAPDRATLLAALAISVLAGLFPVSVLVQLVSLGTLLVFIAICTSVIVLRRRHADLTRPFRVPFGPLVPLLGIIVFLYMLIGVPGETWGLFGIWTVAGLIIYLTFGMRSARRIRTAGIPGDAAI